MQSPGCSNSALAKYCQGKIALVEHLHMGRQHLALSKTKGNGCYLVYVCIVSDQARVRVPCRFLHRSACRLLAWRLLLFDRDLEIGSRQACTNSTQLVSQTSPSVTKWSLWSPEVEAYCHW